MIIKRPSEILVSPPLVRRFVPMRALFRAVAAVAFAAICTRDGSGRKLSNTPSFTVPGPEG